MVRIKLGGGTDGHNGLRSRLGTGRPVRGRPEGFVLSDFNSLEWVELGSVRPRRAAAVDESAPQPILMTGAGVKIGNASASLAPAFRWGRSDQEETWQARRQGLSRIRGNLHPPAGHQQRCGREGNQSTVPAATASNNTNTQQKPPWIHQELSSLHTVPSAKRECSVKTLWIQLSSTPRTTNPSSSLAVCWYHPTRRLSHSKRASHSAKL